MEKQHSNSDNPKVSPVSVDQYLQSVLGERDVQAGIGGNCNFNIIVNKILIVQIANLTKTKATELFDLFDEHNKMNKKNPIHLKIQITENGEELDMNYLPNIFTEFI